MRKFLSAAAVCLAAMNVGRAQAQTTTLIDDFDGGGVAAGTREISPAVGTFTGGGQMFQPGSRSELVVDNADDSLDRGLPFGISDDSVAAATGSTVFAADVVGLFGQSKTDRFFGVSDTTNPGNPGGLATALWTINTTGLSNLSLAVDFGAMGNFESTATSGNNTDFAEFAVSFDGGANFTPIMKFAPNEDIDKVYRQLDQQVIDMTTPAAIQDPMVYLGADGVLGGTDDVVLDKSDPATGVLDTLTAEIPGTGTSMILRFSAATDGTGDGGEGIAFDNLKLLSGGGGGPDADFDDDGDVDGTDFNTWKAAFGQTAAGTADTDSDSDGEDFLIWQRTFTGPALVGAVPEPATAGLMALGLAAAALRRRRAG